MLGAPEIPRIEKFLGKLDKVEFGSGGYDNAMFGFTFGLRWNGSTCCSKFIGTWGSPPTEGAKWTIADQHKIFLECFLDVKKIMTEAKVDDFYQLVGKPIEVTVEGGICGKVTSWRILTEVL